MNQDLASLEEGDKVCLCFHRRGYSIGLMKYTFCSSFFLFNSAFQRELSLTEICKHLLCAEDVATLGATDF